MSIEGRQEGRSNREMNVPLYQKREKEKDRRELVAQWTALRVPEDEPTHKLIDQAEYSRIADIFKKIARRNGIQEFSFVPFEDIYFTSKLTKDAKRFGGLSPRGAYSRQHGVVGIGMDAIYKEAESTRLSVKSVMYHDLVHELSHSALFNAYSHSVIGKNVFGGLATDVTMRRDGIAYGDLEHDYYRMAEEWITNLLMREVLEELFPSNHPFSEELQKVKDDYKAIENYMEAVLDILSHELEIDKPTLRKSLIRAAFHGITLDDEPMRSYITSIIGGSALGQTRDLRSDHMTIYAAQSLTKHYNEMLATSGRNDEQRKKAREAMVKMLELSEKSLEFI